MKKQICFCLVLLLPLLNYAQANLDSLWGIWNDEAQADTNRLNAIGIIARNNNANGNPDSAIIYSQLQFEFATEKGLMKYQANAQGRQGSSFKMKRDYKKAIMHYSQCLEIFEKIKNEKATAYTLIDLGHCYQLQWDIPNALKNYNRAIKICEAIGERKLLDRALNNIGIIHYKMNDLTKALDYYARSLKISEELGDQRGVAGKLINMGMVYSKKGEDDKAIAYLNRGKKICEETGQKQFLTNALKALGRIYQRAGQFDKAIDLFDQTLKLSGELGNKDNEAKTLTDIGILYIQKKEYPKALAYYTKSLQINEEIGDKRGVAGSMINIGSIYFEQKEFAKALPLLIKGGEMAKEVGAKEFWGIALNEIGSIYMSQHKYEKGLPYYQESMNVHEEIGDKHGFAMALSNVGLSHYYQNRPDEAIDPLERSLLIFQEFGDISQIEVTAVKLFNVYKSAGNYKKAMEALELHMDARDSLQRIENERAVIRFEFNQKALKDSLAQVEKNLQTDLAFQAQLYQKDQIRNILVVLGIIALLLAVGFYTRNRFVRRTNTQLKAAKDRAEQSEAVKEKFLNNISHEFRTPLTVIMGMTEEWEKNPDEAKKMIFRNSESLLGLINQLLDLSKLEAGKLDLNLRQGNIVPYLQYLSESFQSYAETKDIQLLFYQEVEELVMDSDEEKVKHIVSNLLSNAIKFTPQQGKVKVHVDAQEQNGKKEFILKVKDTGMGIEPSALPHIFDRFYQVGDTSTYSREGTGIGLALAKELVEMMQGHISVKSEIGKGTEFTVVLPVNREAEQQQVEIPLSRKDMMQAEQVQPTFPLIADAISNNQVLPVDDLPLLLIIEDNPDVATYIETCLEGLYQVEKAENGQVGIDRAIEMVPDIIITDVMMPQKDGFEVCNTLKHDARTSHIPIIMLTAKASVEDKLTGLERGADAYLIKPFNKKELFIRLQKLIELRQQLQKRYSGAALFDPAPTSEVPLEIEDAFLVKLKNIVAAHLDDPEFSIPQFCQEAGMSRTQLHRKLKALTDKSATAFIRSYRLRKGKELLLTTDLNVSEIAYDVGFQNPTYFSTRFFEEFGVTPSEIRTR